jgi:two-component SAPR family response regulator
MIRILREINPALKFIACSGYGRTKLDERTLQELSSAGVNDFLMKPYTADLLLRTIDKLLHVSASSEEGNQGSKKV